MPGSAQRRNHSLNRVDSTRGLVAVGVPSLGVWDTIVGGAIVLAGVVLAQWWQSKRAREEAVERRADEKAGRLRAAYHEVVAAADSLKARAFQLVKLIGDATGVHPDDWESLLEKVPEAAGGWSTSAARAALLLEADDADQAVLAALDSARTEAVNVRAALVLRNISTPENADDRLEGMNNALRRLEETVYEVTRLARARLVELGQPPPPKKR